MDAIHLIGMRKLDYVEIIGEFNGFASDHTDMQSSIKLEGPTGKLYCPKSRYVNQNYQISSESNMLSN